MTTSTYLDAKFLIVDDVASNIQVLEKILTRGGYSQFQGITDSRQVVSTFQRFQPDIILLDLMMPHLDGVEVIDQLKPLTEGTYLPILVLTADVGSDAKRRALSAGAKDFLTKPIDAPEVLLRVNNLLETRFLYQQMQSQAERRIQEQTLYLDQANDAIVVRNLQGEIIYWNHGAERTYGWSEAEVRSTHADEFILNEPPTKMEEIHFALESQGYWEGELRQKTRDGQELIVDSRWSPVHDEANQVSGFLSINTNITEKKALESQFLQVQKMESIGQLAAGVAHDFNNLLTVITGFSELLLSTERHQDEQDRLLLQEIQKAGERAAGLTQQLLAFSRKKPTKMTLLNLSKVVLEMEKMVRRLLGEDISLQIDCPEGLGQVLADSGQIEQVLLNLVVNARDAMPTGGRLSIHTRLVEKTQQQVTSEAEAPARAYIALSVTDTGMGMDEKTQQQIFQPFFTTKPADRGTGLGLSTVQGIVKQINGFITVASQPDQGTSFTVFIPRAQDEERHEQNVFTSQSYVGGKEAILLVEDEASVRGLARSALVGFGYTVLDAGDGEGGLFLARNHPDVIDLVISDVVLPGINGREMVSQLAVEFPELKVLYITGYTDDAVIRNGIRTGEVAMLQKPFTPRSLAEKVREVIYASEC